MRFNLLRVFSPVRVCNSAETAVKVAIAAKGRQSK
jgi:hypothetical protein